MIPLALIGNLLPLTKRAAMPLFIVVSLLAVVAGGWYIKYSIDSKNAEIKRLALEAFALQAALDGAELRNQLYTEDLKRYQEQAVAMRKEIEEARTRVRNLAASLRQRNLTNEREQNPNSTLDEHNATINRLFNLDGKVPPL